MICSCLQKQSDIPFMKERDTFLEHIKVKKNGIMYLGINVPWGIFLMRNTAYYIKHPFNIPRMIKCKLENILGRKIYF